MTRRRQVTIADGRNVAFDKLLLATGAEPVRLDIPGASEPHVHVLRSLPTRGRSSPRPRRHDAPRDRRKPRSRSPRRYASKLEVHVVAPERRPTERVLGREFGGFIRALHESTALSSISRRRHRDRRTTSVEGRSDLPPTAGRHRVRPRTAAERAGSRSTGAWS
jgi:hypothetical protein